MSFRFLPYLGPEGVGGYREFLVIRNRTWPLTSCRPETPTVTAARERFDQNVTSLRRRRWRVSSLRLFGAIQSQMEDTMCWEMDYKFLAEHKKAQEARIKQEQRAGVIDQLLDDANKQDQKTNVEGTPVAEVAPAE